jgi:hypothetical protein
MKGKARGEAEREVGNKVRGDVGGRRGESENQRIGDAGEPREMYTFSVVRII